MTVTFLIAYSFFLFFINETNKKDKIKKDIINFSFVILCFIFSFKVFIPFYERKHFDFFLWNEKARKSMLELLIDSFRNTFYSVKNSILNQSHSWFIPFISVSVVIISLITLLVMLSKIVKKQEIENKFLILCSSTFMIIIFVIYSVYPDNPRHIEKFLFLQIILFYYLLKILLGKLNDVFIHFKENELNIYLALLLLFFFINSSVFSFSYINHDPLDYNYEVYQEMIFFSNNEFSNECELLMA
ncbi:MAG: hypothetical protein ACOCP8_05560, partial [archaeon]